MKPQHIIFWATSAVCGCLDVNLLDEMQPATSALDGGNEPGDGSDTENPIDTSDEDEPEADTADSEAPNPQEMQCDAAERRDRYFCIAEGSTSASLRFKTDEPAVVSVIVAGNERPGIFSEAWSEVHHVIVGNLAIGVETSIAVEIEDVNTNTRSLDVTVAGLGGPTVVITEILANPLGPEPSQEFVEIANLSRTEAVDISNWMIDDNGDADGDLLPPNTHLMPCQVALLVSPDYSPNEGSDPEAAPGTLIITLDTSIGSNGLKNSEAESVELYNASGVLMSQYRGNARAPADGCGTVRITAEAPDGDPDAFAPEPNRSATPGNVPTLIRKIHL
ncbi:MAG: lamin tail domain-containing protein [Myxococcota bacterium]|nr:lamin tail domain-containing protein [Myxococcota bacterium]